ncbi:MAG TPA: hypothetical protein PKL67_17480, partial [Anaerolineae bacterium]|nr:hypothetical protein [Anaerolineae bacterium]
IEINVFAPAGGPNVGFDTLQKATQPTFGPPAEQLQPLTVNRSPFTVHRSPLTVHRPPFTVHR